MQLVFQSPVTLTKLEPNHLLSTLLSNFDGMIYRCRIDDQWTMEFVSEGCQALTGYLPEDLLLNSRVSYEEITYSEDRAYVRETIAYAIACHKRFDLEYRIVRADGQIRWVLERGTAIARTSKVQGHLEGFVQDITERKLAADALAETERRYRSIFDNSLEGIFQSTLNDGYLVVNKALAKMYGYDSPEDMIANLRDIENGLYVDPQRRDDFKRIMNERGSVANFESQIYRRDGRIIWISENARAVRDGKGNVLFFEGTIQDITERKMHEAEMRFQVTHDALTGLPNRTMLYDRLQQAVLSALRHKNFVAVVFVDVDQFKFINDSLGHEAGDALLKIVAQRLSSCVRQSDTVARHGGDEFVMLLTDHHHEGSVTHTLQRVLQSIAQPWVIDGREIQVTCSLGVSLCPDDGQNTETLLKKADAAMFKAKSLGRNNFQYFDPTMASTSVDRLEMLSNLRQALLNQEFVLHYQPKIKLATGAIVGAEALIRWQTVGGMVSPGLFIPIAEETGLILQIGEWVLRAACKQSRAWQDAGHAPIPISVNLSPLQLERSNILEIVTSALDDAGLDARLLELEITEGAMMRNVEQSLAKLRQLKQLGVQISVDDFGTGYSSLSYLKRFPLDTMKIDQSFVRDIAYDPDDASIVTAIISLSHILNLKVVAEGVETREQYQFLLDNGCDEVQGFYIARPLPQAEFIGLLQKSICGAAASSSSSATGPITSTAR